MQFKQIITMMVGVSKGIFFIFIILFSSPVFSQTRWYDPLKADFNVVQNQGWANEIGKTYHRLPNRAEEVVRTPVWNLSHNSAGLAVHFYSNAEKIEVRYQVTEGIAMPHMPATGKSGVDLYAIDSDGKWRLATGKYNFGDTVTYIYEGLPQSQYHKRGFEYRLYLPLYNSVKWMQIGTPASAEFEFIPTLKEAPIVVYGTSIAQGGCASRPGMGWTNILSRKLDYPVINLAFSGNGPLEKELVDLMDEIESSLYIYDCLPNMGSLPSEEAVKRTIYGVRKVREKHNTPILLVDHIGYRNEEVNQSSRELGERMNNALTQAYDSLIDMGVKNIYYLRRDMINFPVDGCVDYIHPNDLGMQAYADAYEKMIREILSMPAGNLKTTQPVSQRREPYIYEWKKRHENILQDIQQKAPSKVIIGNSITHYWGGSTEHQNGSRSWESQMVPSGYFNLGYGWDRIENVLWRVYHGELSGYDMEEVVLMIGTNNLGLNSDEEIVEGLRLLLKQISVRQPKAKIKVIGLFPRRDAENHVKTINERISKMVLFHGYSYMDVGHHLLQKDGKIDESLFLDGLHPNEEGYLKIVSDIVTSNALEEKPVIRFGVIADIQYCDCDTRGKRYYREALQKLDQCVDQLNSEKVQFTVNLGDLVDRDTPRNLDPVLSRLNKLNATVYNLTGNHDYENIDNEQLYALLNMPSEYYSFQQAGWRFVMLNTNEIASYSNVKDTWKEKELKEMKNNVRKTTGQDAADYNGGVSSKQLQWLQQLLEKSKDSDEKILIFSHHPLGCVKGLTALNDQDIVSMASKFSCVKALIAGHHHDGAFCEVESLPSVVAEGMIETEDQNAYGIIELFPDKLVLQGYERMTSRVIHF